MGQGGTWPRVCLALTPGSGWRRSSGSTLMAAKNESAFETAFTVSIEGRLRGPAPGNLGSRPGRAHCQVAIDPKTPRPGSWSNPGHVFPLKAKARRRAGTASGPEPRRVLSIWAAAWRGSTRAAVICEDHERRRDDGRGVPGSRRPTARRHGLKMVTVGRIWSPTAAEAEKLIERVVATKLPDGGSATFVRRGLPLAGSTTKHHVALVKGEGGGGVDRRARPACHSECLHRRCLSTRCRCRLRRAARVGAVDGIETEGRGVRAAVPEARRAAGSALAEQAAGAYKLSGGGSRQTVRREPSGLGLPADLRDYGIGAQILVDLGPVGDPDPDQPTRRRSPAPWRATV